MIQFRKYKAQSLHFEAEQDSEAFSTLRLESYTEAPSLKKINIKYQGKKKAIMIIFVIIVVGLLIFYFRSLYNDSPTLLNEKNEEMLQIDTQKYDLQANIKKVQQQLNQQQQENKILNQKVQKLEQLIGKSNKEQDNQSMEEKKKKSPLNVFIFQYENYQLLPINPIKLIDGKSVASFMYKDEAKIKSRSDFIQQRISFINSNQNLPNAHLVKYNFIKNEEMLKQAISQNEKDWLRLQQKYHISSIKQELEFCLIVPSYNNNVNFRIEGNLNSIFTQNYTNFHVVVVNDGSTDNTGEIYRQYFKFYKINKSKFIYVQNPKRLTAMENIYYASMRECTMDSIIMMLDGDDEFIGRNVLKFFNWGFQSKKLGVMYTNFYWYQQPVTLRYGFTQQYTENEKKNNLYRNTPMKFSHLRAFRAQFMYKINVKDFQDQNGAFYTVGYDMAIFLPAMELACGRVEKLQGQVHYLYNTGTGLNDDYLSRGKQVQVEQRVRAQKKYDCLKQFEQRMKK